MSDDVISMYRALCDRDPTHDELRMIRRLIRGLPEDVYNSPVMMADIVLRTEQQYELKAALQQATHDARQKIHADIQPQVDKAALAALNRIRDLLPIDAKDRLVRLLRWGSAWTVLVMIVAGATGWFVHAYFAGREESRHQAVYEREFNRCVEAAEGAAILSTGMRNGLRYDGAAYRSVARNCAAEYADRRAGL